MNEILTVVLVPTTMSILRMALVNFGISVTLTKYRTKEFGLYSVNVTETTHELHADECPRVLRDDDVNLPLRNGGAGAVYTGAIKQKQPSMNAWIEKEFGSK